MKQINSLALQLVCDFVGDRQREPQSENETLRTHWTKLQMARLHNVKDHTRPGFFLVPTQNDLAGTKVVLVWGLYREHAIQTYIKSLDESEPPLYMLSYMWAIPISLYSACRLVRDGSRQPIGVDQLNPERERIFNELVAALFPASLTRR